jgi:hypothetical protein
MILEKFPWAVEKNMYSAAVGWNIPQKSVKTV